ncbi:MAG: ethanolamine ammonia-lyase subunit EutC [Gemmatales bacterium]
MRDALNKPSEVLPDVAQQALARTPARLFVGRAGTGYPTHTALKLRADHAAARDAVYQQVDLERDFGAERISSYGLFTTQTQARTRTEYLMRPDRGRLFDVASQELIQRECPPSAGLQIVLGDGLSASAVAQHGARLLDVFRDKASDQSWKLGRPFLIRFCRVGIMNEIGRLLHPQVVVLLIGERPGLVQSESLSAYLAYRPVPGHTDAQRNLISNIHPQGVSLDEAAERILHLAARMREEQCSGVMIKEELPSTSTLLLS